MPGEVDFQRSKPLTKEEVLELRKEALLRYGRIYRKIPGHNEFTCDGCEFVNICTLAYDLYNTNGDCLLEK